MAAINLDKFLYSWRDYRWTNAGLMAMVLWSGGMSAIAATAASFSEQHPPPAAKRVVPATFATQHKDEVNSQVGCCVGAHSRAPSANVWDLMAASSYRANRGGEFQPSQSQREAPAPAKPAPLTASSPRLAAVETAQATIPEGFSPDPAYTAPLPPLDPSTQPLPPPPQPLAPVPAVNGGFGEPAPDFDTYRLGPGDSFFVNVRQFPELSFQATLDIQGNVVVPLQGVISFNGLTLDQTEALLAQIYNQYVISPDVSVTLVAQRGVEVTVLGEVVRPGYYPLGAPQIAAALLSAGGTTGEADLRDVVIQRQLPDGQVLERVVDLFTPLKEGQEIPDVALQDGDVILVDRLNPAELDEYDRNLVSRSTLAKPTITVRFLNYGSGSLGGTTSGSLTALDLPNGSRFADALVRVNLNPDTSNLGEVALIRFDEEAGRAVATTLDANEAFRGIPAENPPLQENDVIIVNRTLLARITYTLNTFTQPFRDVLGFLLFFDQLTESTESLFGP